MNPQVSHVMADMSHLLWQARVHNFSAIEVKRRFLLLREQHLAATTAQNREAVSAELERWSGHIAQLFNPAFLDQAI